MEWKNFAAIGMHARQSTIKEASIHGNRGESEVRGSTSRPSPQSPKGILGSPPPRVYEMHAAGQCKSFIFSSMGIWWLVKKHYPRGKIYASGFSGTTCSLDFLFLFAIASRKLDRD
jgi:hypothetical protein